MRIKMVEIKFKRIYDDVKSPVQGNEGDAGYDVHARSEGIIRPFETKLFKLGLTVEIPEGYVLIREGDLIRKPASYPSPDLLSDASPAVKVFSVI